MTIDGVTIAIGLDLYCLAYGRGTVERIDGEVITVLFQSGKRYNYRGGTNVSFVDRTLYHKEPFILTSEGDGNSWLDIQTALRAVLVAIRAANRGNQ